MNKTLLPLLITMALSWCPCLASDSMDSKLAWINDPKIKNEVKEMLEENKPILDQTETMKVEGMINSGVIGNVKRESTHIEFETIKQQADKRVMFSIYFTTSGAIKGQMIRSDRMIVGLDFRTKTPFMVSKPLGKDLFHLLVRNPDGSIMIDQTIEKTSATVQLKKEDVIWPTLPVQIDVSTISDQKIAQSIKDNFEILTRVLDIVKLMSDKAKYKDSPFGLYGNIEGWGNIKKITYSIFKGTHSLRALNIYLNKGENVDEISAQFDPLWVREIKDGKTTLIYKCNQSGQVE